MCGFLGDDFTSMAHSLELRVPLVDWQIFDLAGRLPGVYKLDLLGGKRVLRSAFDDLMPPWIRQDQRKKTFTLPLMKWLRHSLWAARVYDVLVTPQALLTQWLDPKAVKKVVEAYYHSSATTKHVWHLGQPVSMLLILESWLQQQRAKCLS
jgi:asparagine synthase (glutamine-hydrolysing)